MTLQEAQQIVADIQLAGGLADHAFILGSIDAQHGYLQSTFLRPDAQTGLVERGYGRKWLLSRFMTESELVLTALKACLANAEHEIRERFSYQGKRLFSPHVKVSELLRLVETDERPAPPA